MTTTVYYTDGSGNTLNFVAEQEEIEVSVTPFSPGFEGGQCNIPYRIYVDRYRKRDGEYILEEVVTESAFHQETGGANGPIIGPIYAFYSNFCQGPFVLRKQYPNCEMGVIATEGRNSITLWDETYGHEENRVTYYGNLTRVEPVDPNQLDNCGNASDLCKLEITYQGLVIFTDVRSCPITYEISDEDCPPGTVKCNSPGYPGYCCIPCDSIAQRINNLASRL